MVIKTRVKVKCREKQYQKYGSEDLWVLTDDGEVDDGVLGWGEEEVHPAAVNGLVSILDGEQFQVGAWG